MAEDSVPGPNVHLDLAACLICLSSLLITLLLCGFRCRRSKKMVVQPSEHVEDKAEQLEDNDIPDDPTYTVIQENYFEEAKAPDLEVHTNVLYESVDMLQPSNSDRPFVSTDKCIYSTVTPVCTTEVVKDNQMALYATVNKVQRQETQEEPQTKDAQEMENSNCQYETIPNEIITELTS